MRYEQLKNGTCYRHGQFIVDGQTTKYIATTSGFWADGFLHYPDNYVEATPEETEWFRLCEKLEKFVPKPKLLHYEIY